MLVCWLASLWSTRKVQATTTAATVVALCSGVAADGDGSDGGREGEGGDGVEEKIIGYMSPIKNGNE